MERKSAFAALLTAVLLAFCLSHSTAQTQSSPRKIDVIVKRFAYEPGEVTVKKGQPVVIALKSTDVAHGLRFRELNLDTKIPAGGASELKFTPDKTGDFVGHCSVFCGPGHGAMTLTIHVVE